MEKLHKEVAETKRFDKDDFEWRPFLRQLIVASSSWVIYFCMGLFMGGPTTIIPQMRREANNTNAVTEEMASWLSSTFSYSAIPWVFILPNLIGLIGRKKTAIIISLTTITTFLVFYFSTTPSLLLATEVLIGLAHASVITVNVIVISEYTTPKYRGLFLTLKSASLFWGIWISNAIGTFFHWRYIPMFGLVCSLYSLTVFFWPESPHWLASKKRFYECKKSHRWLKGTGQKQEEELDRLIKCHSNEEQITSVGFMFVKRKEFYMPLLLSILVIAQYHLSGKFVITIYAVEIMKKIMENETTAYRSMLILDAITVCSCYVGCVTANFFKRRTIVLVSSSVAISFLFIMSLYLYLIKLSVINENMYLSLLFLSGFSISISFGPMIMATSLYGELIPVRYKSLCIIIIALVFFTLHGTLLKVAPVIFKTLSLPGTFLFYAISSSVCVILIIFYLPETKDKTLLEIEEYFKDSGSVGENKNLLKSTLP